MDHGTLINDIGAFLNLVWATSMRCENHYGVAYLDSLRRVIAAYYENRLIPLRLFDMGGWNAGVWPLVRMIDLATPYYATKNNVIAHGSVTVLPPDK